MKPPEIGSVDELVAWLRETGDVLYAPAQLTESARDRSLLAESGPTGDKESWFKPCTGCGLTGDGVTLTAATSRR